MGRGEACFFACMVHGPSVLPLRPISDLISKPQAATSNRSPPWRRSMQHTSRQFEHLLSNISKNNLYQRASLFIRNHGNSNPAAWINWQGHRISNMDLDERDQGNRGNSKRFWWLCKCGMVFCPSWSFLCMNLIVSNAFCILFASRSISYWMTPLSILQIRATKARSLKRNLTVKFCWMETRLLYWCQEVLAHQRIRWQRNHRKLVEGFLSRFHLSFNKHRFSNAWRRESLKY